MAWLEERTFLPPVPRKQGKFRFRRSRERERATKIRYGIGMWLGLVAVHLAKRVVRSIPVVGRLAQPVLGLFPTVLVGPALGAAVVFVLDEGDVDVAADKMKHMLKKTTAEVETVARDLHDDLRQLATRHDCAPPQLLPELKQNLSDLEATIKPALEREYKAARHRLERLDRERAFQAQLERAAAGSSSSR